MTVEFMQYSFGVKNGNFGLRLVWFFSCCMGIFWPRLLWSHRFSDELIIAVTPTFCVLRIWKKESGTLWREVTLTQVP